jgi:hypothetical protein
MNIERLPEPIDALMISDTFDKNDLKNIINEIKSLSSKCQQNGELWLSDVYKDLDMSAINTTFMNIFFNNGIIDSLKYINSLYSIYEVVNNHSTRLKYYGEGQSYPLHYDAAAFTVMSFITEDPKNFTGGNLILQVGGDIAYEQEIKNNMTLIFPSSYFSSITEVKINDKSIEDSGLYEISSYLFIESR